ncbi:MAG: hypothetical protein ABW252_21980 [Polyangiales bacterium]
MDARAVDEDDHTSVSDWLARLTHVDQTAATDYRGGRHEIASRL